MRYNRLSKAVWGSIAALYTIAVLAFATSVARGAQVPNLPIMFVVVFASVMLMARWSSRHMNMKGAKAILNRYSPEHSRRPSGR